MKTKKIYAMLVLTGLIAIAAGTVSAASLADRWTTCGIPGGGGSRSMISAS